MDLVPPDIHRALAYAVSVADQGYLMTTAELDLYAASPAPREARYERSPWSRAMSSVRIPMLEPGPEIAPEETASHYLLRVRWAVEEAGRVRITELGRAVYRAAELEDISTDEITTVVLEANDPIALARVLERFAMAGTALLVDPYFRATELPAVLNCTSITRVLTSAAIGTQGLATLELMLSRLHYDRPFDVRVAREKPHDRYLVPDAGPVHWIGTSLNGVGKDATVTGHLNDASDQVRSHYETLWSQSKPLPLEN